MTKVILDYYGFRKEMIVDKNAFKWDYIDLNLYNRIMLEPIKEPIKPEELTFATVRFYFFGEYEDGKPIFIYK